jgi:type 1 glutamine amidotransferase
MRCLVFLLIVVVGPGALQGAELPKVLFFANPMSSDNDVIRRPRPDVLSVAERHFARLGQGVFDVTITQDGAEVTRAKLARYKAVVFFTAINPPGVDVDGLIDWVREGGAFVGIHSTANTFQGHPAFGAMLGARYDRRPWRTREAPQTRVRVQVVDRTNPATRHLGESFAIADDIYQFKDFDRDRVRLLLRLEPESLDLDNPKVNRRDEHFPVSWAKAHGQGRVFYTALGDWEETWKDPRYRLHLTGGIRWAMRLEDDEKLPGGPPSREPLRKTR